MKKILFILIIMLIPKNIYAEEVDLASSASSAIMIEASTGEIIFEKNAHEKLAPASMTKIMSMLLIMENIDNGNLKMDEKITASSKASSMGGSQIFLETGEVMTVKELLKGIAIASGNDATVAMAERIAGTEESFVKLMNDRANELDLKNTNFKNSTGLDAEGHYSTAYDMAIMAKELVKYNIILEFTGTYEDYLREGTDKSFWLVNTNKLVRFYQGVDGLKTGFTSEAGYCLTSTAKKDNMRLITVVMHEPDSATRNSETSSMLDYGFNMYAVNNVLSTNTILNKVEVILGKNEYVEVVPSTDVNILNNKTKQEKNITYEVEYEDIIAPVKIGDKVGKLLLYENNKKIMEVDITVNKNIDKASIFTIFIRNLRDIIIGNI